MMEYVNPIWILCTSLAYAAVEQLKLAPRWVHYEAEKGK